MNVYSPLDSVKRLEAAGLEWRRAAPVASEINDGSSEFVTKERLNAALEKTTIRIGSLTSGIVAVATAVLGLLISIK